MEHQLFQSKLKPLIDGNLLSKIIRSSSSGETPHRTAAMELIFERSVRERRERAVARVRDSLQPDPVPDPRRNEGLDAPIQPAEPPAPTPRPVSRTPSDPRASWFFTSETAHNPKLIPRPKPTQRAIPVATQVDTGAHRSSMPNMRAHDSDSEAPEETFLKCSIPSCGASLGRKRLKHGLYCRVCSSQKVMRCANCGVRRSKEVKKCGGCGMKFAR